MINSTETRRVPSQGSLSSPITFLKVHFSPASTLTESAARDCMRLRSPAPPQHASSMEKLRRILSPDAAREDNKRNVRKAQIEFVSGQRVPCDWVPIPDFPAPYAYTMLSLADAQADVRVSHRHFLY